MDFQASPRGGAEADFEALPILYVIYIYLLKRTNNHDHLRNTEGGALSNDRDITSFVWTVGLYDFNLTVSNLFFFWLNYETAKPEGASSAYFNIVNEQSGSSSAATTTTASTTTTTTGPAAAGSTTTFVEIISPPITLIPTSLAITISTTQSPTFSSSPSSAENGPSMAGIALGLGIPAVLAILVALFVLLKRKTLPIPNPTISKRPQIYEATGDFTHRPGAELSGDRNPHNNLFELPGL
jgi:hypothetical protein